MKVDISKFITRDFAMHNNITGYAGVDTMPPCNGRMCYYFIENVYNITQDQMNFVKVEGVAANNRAVQLGTMKAFLLRGEGLFAEEA